MFADPARRPATLTFWKAVKTEKGPSRGGMTCPWSGVLASRCTVLRSPGSRVYWWRAGLTYGLMSQGLLILHQSNTRSP
jgi:hypothetical protein